MCWVSVGFFLCLEMLTWSIVQRLGLKVRLSTGSSPEFIHKSLPNKICIVVLQNLDPYMVKGNTAGHWWVQLPTRNKPSVPLLRPQWEETPIISSFITLRFHNLNRLKCLLICTECTRTGLCWCIGFAELPLGFTWYWPHKHLQRHKPHHFQWSKVHEK